jgi:hypothetical protein
MLISRRVEEKQHSTQNSQNGSLQDREVVYQEVGSPLGGFSRYGSPRIAN